MNTRDLVVRYRELLLEDEEEARRFLEQHRENELLVSLVEFGEALVAAIMKNLQPPALRPSHASSDLHGGDAGDGRPPDER